MKNKWHMWTDPTAFCEWGWGWGTAGEEIQEVDWLLLHTHALWLDDWRSIWPWPKRGRTVAVSVYVCCQSSGLMLQPSWEMLALVLSATRLRAFPFREKETTVHFCCYRFCTLRKKKEEVNFLCFLCLTALMRRVNSLIHFYAMLICALLQ